MAATPPVGTITPAVYTKIKEQNYETCVPMSLSTAMDRFRAMKVGNDYENFSISYIFGNGGFDWGMYFLDAVQNCINYGSPRWDLVSTNFSGDEKSITDSNYTYTNAPDYARANALKQRFSGYSRIDFYNGPAVANAIRNYGYFMFNFRIPEDNYSFYWIGSDGIVPQPPPYVPPVTPASIQSDSGGSSGYSGANHSVSLIGLTTKNGKPHWIAQNSWGDWWGDNGYCYIPYDWGYDDPNLDWALESYSVYNSSVTNYVPASPTNVAGTKTGDKSANITWNTSLTGATYTVLASQVGKNEWWVKGRTTGLFLNIVFDTSYTYEIRVLSSVGDVYSDYSNITIVYLLNIAPWEWWTPKVSGGDFNLTYNEFMALIAKMNEVREARGMTSVAFLINNTYLTASNFKAVASRINEINGGVATECLNVAKGDYVYAWYFENLKTTLNNAITT